MNQIKQHSFMKAIALSAVLIAMVMVVSAGTSGLASAQKPTQKKQRAKTSPKPVSELAKLREDYINATKDLKNSLEKLLAIYESNVTKAESKFAVSKTLYDEGLIARQQVDETERALAMEKERVADIRRQLTSADTQIANTLVEARAEEQMAKAPKLSRGGYVATTSFIRYNGTAVWGLNDAWKIQRFFTDAFKRPLPIAVFGQGAIHDRWHLDHRNAMDVSLNPDDMEGPALMNFLRSNGIPFSAFRQAIPGTATGPHIHIGRPSHRY